MSGLDAAFTTDRRSFTAMSGDATLAIMGRISRSANLNGGYPLNLNANDAKNLIEALSAYHELAGEYEGENSLADWAADFVSSIGETLNIESV